jgi:hypothetical protein
VIWRLEHKDGGGPWFTRDEKIEFKDKGIYGCRSLRELVRYFAKEMEAAEGYMIKIYRGKVIWEGKKEIVFMPKGRGLRVGIVKGGKWLVFKF